VIHRIGQGNVVDDTLSIQAVGAWANVLCSQDNRFRVTSANSLNWWRKGWLVQGLKKVVL